jgi:hypothetical protein
MEYQMLAYFDKFTFSGLLFPQIAISCMTSTLCQNGTFPIPHISMLPTPHCLCYVANFTLTHSQFHIAKSAIPHCQIVNFTLRALHCQLVELTSIFWGCPHFFIYCPLKNQIFCMMPKIDSLGAQTRLCWDFFIYPNT